MYPCLHTHKSPAKAGLFICWEQGIIPTQNVWRWAQSAPNPSPAAIPVIREIYREISALNALQWDKYPVFTEVFPRQPFSEQGINRGGSGNLDDMNRGQTINRQGDLNASTSKGTGSQRSNN
jgi:hypothetical protein